MSQAAAFLDDLLHVLVARDADVLRLTPSAPPIVFVSGRSVPLCSTVLNATHTYEIASAILSASQSEELGTRGSCEFELGRLKNVNIPGGPFNFKITKPPNDDSLTIEVARGSDAKQG